MKRIRIVINGEEKALETELSISALLASLSAPDDGTAVAVNSKIVPKNRHQETMVADGDRIEIIRAIGGG